MFHKVTAITLVLFSVSAYSQNVKDSSSHTTKITSDIKTHTVVKGETFYALTKKYKVSQWQLFEANPELKNKPDLTLGQKINIPKSKTALPSNTEDKKTKVIPNLNPRKSTVETKVAEVIKKTDPKSFLSANEHLVKPKETVFSIAKMYGLEIEDLLKINNLESQKINIGQILNINPKFAKPDASQKTEIETKKLETEIKKTNKTKKKSEEGIAEVINTKNKTRKLLALHRSAPIGSIIYITNEANGSGVSAKVVGSIDENGPDQEILVKLSPAAYRRLNPKDSKLRARVEYYIPNNINTL